MKIKLNRIFSFHSGYTYIFTYTCKHTHTHVHIEITREQSVPANYTIVGASNDQEKLPKYPPTFVTVSFVPGKKLFSFSLVSVEKRFKNIFN